MGSYTESWLELEKSMGGQRMALQGSVEEIRAQYAGLLQMLQPQMPKPSDAVATKDGELDGVKYRIYTPVEAAKGGKLPLGVYTHGGGWVVGDLDGEDLMCRAVAEHAPSILASVDYRLAPEHKTPTQLEDSLNVYKWARQNAASIGGDPDKMYSIGGSAGGCLALAVANRIVAHESLRSSCKGVVAMVPITLHPDHVPDEYRSMYKANKENAENVPILNAQSMNDFFTAAGVDPKDKSLLTALDKDNHKNFPPTYLATCEFDPLRDDGVIMEHALKEAGVPVKRDHYKGLPHYFWIFPSIPEGQQFFGNLVAGTKWVIGQMK